VQSNGRNHTNVNQRARHWTGETGKRENQVKPIKMLGLAALGALLAMAFVGVSSAMAGTTKLCSTDVETLAEENSCGAVTHVHETTLSGEANQATLLSSVINVKCDVLFLGDTLGEGAPLVIHGEFTYTNCNKGSCTVTEESLDSLIEVLRTSHETASVTGEGEVNVHCGFFINCTYNGEGLEGSGKGPLLSSETNGEVTLTGQETSRVSGFCPESAFLDIKTTPLSATYLGGQALGHYCVEYTRAIGFYLNVNSLKKSECTEKDAKRSGKFGLVLGPAGIAAGTVVCVNLSEKVGLWTKISKAGVCEEDDKTNTSLYEKGTIQ
jgi:hypothetical protein